MNGFMTKKLLANNPQIWYRLKNNCFLEDFLKIGRYFLEHLEIWTSAKTGIKLALYLWRL